MMEQITSIQNPKIKLLTALQQKSSERRKAGLFVVEGRQELEHCIAAGYQIDTVFYCPELGAEAPADIRSFAVTKAVYEKIAYRGSTEGLIAEVRTRNLRLDDLKLSERPLIVVLESVEKPGNLGAVLRSADASGVDAVVVCDPLTDMTAPTAIIMGTEHDGLTDLWRQAADAHIRIDMLGCIDSLNVSVSAAILMFEAVRQRQSLVPVKSEFNAGKVGT